MFFWHNKQYGSLGIWTHSHMCCLLGSLILKRKNKFWRCLKDVVGGLVKTTYIQSSPAAKSVVLPPSSDVTAWRKSYRLLEAGFLTAHSSDHPAIVRKQFSVSQYRVSQKQYAKNTRISCCIRSLSAACKPARFSSYSDLQFSVTGEWVRGSKFKAPCYEEVVCSKYMHATLQILDR